MSFGARARIRLGALDHNLQIIREASPEAKLMAVVKANAYGHGMLAVANRLSTVDSLAVARVHEAIQLRESGVTKSIVVLEGLQSKAEQLQASKHELEIVVHCKQQLALLADASAVPVVVWLKIDSGMNRLGFRPEAAPKLIAQMKNLRAVGELRLMTHLACADDAEDPMTQQQLSRFRTVAHGFAGDVSIANSPGVLSFSEFRSAATEFGFTGNHWIRTGISLYGISPFSERNGTDLGLQPAMCFQARLIATKPLFSGERVGYGGQFQSRQDSVLGVIAAGYGDGYSRHFRAGTPIVINGRRVPLVGTVSMDMITVDLGIDSDDKVGDIATLWGEELPVEELAPWADTIAYELVCGITHREPCEYI